MPNLFQPENARVPRFFSPPSEGLGEAILIANRGEIAVRIIRAAQKNGVRTVAVYAADDAESLHVSLADEAVLLSGKTLNDTYLNQQKIIQIAKKSGVEAIHPGYGFLSENAGFAQKVADAGLIFIGPSPENIRLMGEKNQAFKYVESLGIPVLPSFRGTVAELAQHTHEMEFPVMVKGSAGGGGKGMVICESPEELLPALEKAERQAISYFGNGELFVEKYLPRARHLEVQLLADHHGKVLHFFERECSVQRNFQKIIEEAPSPSISENLRIELTSAAVKIARSMNYRNAGTIEFLLDETGHFYFLEMNTRIQVEHPVTEMITNSDLVSLQLLVAAGNPLPINQEDIQISGHAIEVRLCAEDATRDFLPSSGKINVWDFPAEQNIRLETFVSEGINVSPNYDSLLAKIIVRGENREKAIGKMKQVLSETCISGIHTNLSFLSGLIESTEFQENKISTRYIDTNLKLINLQIQDKKENQNNHKLVIAYLIFHFQQTNYTKDSVWNQIGFWRIMQEFEVSIEGEKYKCGIENGKIFRINHQEYLVNNWKLTGKKLEIQIDRQAEKFYIFEEIGRTLIGTNGFTYELQSNSLLQQAKVDRKNLETINIFQNLICADLFGRVLKINVCEGDAVCSGQKLLTLESMKTEIHVLCAVDAMVKKIHIKEGNTVIEKQLLLELEAPSNSPAGGD
ncbi:MAG: biotin carboxylase N-terminal domain-containing protein [Bacteroidota bacterium]|nr:biotin carboxylase N-terminal domain-containing protein [Bacteroidota bacterium]